MTVPNILVLGSGRSAVEAAKEVVAQGCRASIISSSEGQSFPSLGGVEVFTGAGRPELVGYPGRFTVRFDVNGGELTIEGDAVILEDERPVASPVKTEIGLDDLTTLPDDVSSVAVVLGPAAPRSAHLKALMLACELRCRTPAPEVTIFAGGVLVRGTEELIYASAQEAGVRVVRYDKPPVIAESLPRTIVVEDQPSGIELCISPDVLVKEGTDLPDDRSSSSLPSRSTNPGSVIMGPLSSTREGVFLCRAHGRGLFGGELMTEAKAAATLAVTFARTIDERLMTSARVDRDKCSACLTCVRSCPFHAPRIDEEGKAAVEPRLCRSCGICVAICPSRAILLPSDEGWSDAISEGSP